MSVYVDEAIWGFRNMKMCHMIADTHEELITMARTIGVQTKWIQQEGTPDEHFDIAKSKRKLAIAAGAIPIDGRELVIIIDRRRPKPRLSKFHADYPERFADGRPKK